MEGLRGTAIRLAVRDPSCPQGPGLAQGSAAPGAGEGLLLRVAQATTTHTGPDSAIRGSGPACRSPSGWPGGAGARICPQGSRPWGIPRVTRHQPNRPDPAGLYSGIQDRLPFRRGLGWQAPLSSSRAPSPRCKVAVACHVPIRCSWPVVPQAQRSALTDRTQRGNGRYRWHGDGSPDAEVPTRSADTEGRRRAGDAPERGRAAVGGYQMVETVHRLGCRWLPFIAG